MADMLDALTPDELGRLMAARPKSVARRQVLDVNWAGEFYRVSESTLAAADSLRTCWICGAEFKVGDGMTIAYTDCGNKTIHSRCWEEQQRNPYPPRPVPQFSSRDLGPLTK